MTERLLQYIWQLQYFNQNELQSLDGETIAVLNPGGINFNQGPDFLNARIKVGDTIWVGNVELHVLSSHWKDHGHSGDTNYNNVILHVVWLNDLDLNLSFPVLELQSKVSKLLLRRFDELMQAKSFIACEKLVHTVTTLSWASWKDRLVVERLQKKATLIAGYLSQNNNHWEETFWWLIARNFGMPVNNDAFEKIARSLPITLLAKHKTQLHQSEALLFGQAGLLNEKFEEDYPRMLQKEYGFYKNKYKLKPIQAPLHFLRMRPSNFPTIRLAQLAMLVHQSIHLFAAVKAAISLKEITDLLRVTANDYWNYHYTFDEPVSYKQKKLGDQMIDTIIINTIIPILFTYGLHHKEQGYKDRALNWLEQLKPEKNKITSGYALLGVENKSAFDSQALLQLKANYCNEKRCLDCAIGNRIFKASADLVL